jgi:hypothetical protein
LAAGLGGSGLVDLSAVLFRQEQSAFLLVRVLPVVADKGAKRTKGASALPMPSVDAGGALMDAYLRAAPDGLVFTDLQGRVTRANGAFAALAQLSGEDQARGEMLDRWVGRTGVELSVLLGSLRQHGSVGMFATSLRGEVGAVHEVEISAAQLGAVQPPTLAFAVRDRHAYFYKTTGRLAQRDMGDAWGEEVEKDKKQRASDVATWRPWAGQVRERGDFYTPDIDRARRQFLEAGLSPTVF